LPAYPTSASLHGAYDGAVRRRGHLSRPLGRASGHPTPRPWFSPRNHLPGIERRCHVPPPALLLATMPWPVGHCHARAPPLTGSPPTHLLCSEASPSPFSTPCTREPSLGVPCAQNHPPWPPLVPPPLVHVAPPLRPSPSQIEHPSTTLSSHRSLPAQPPLSSLAGTPPPWHAVAAGRHSPWTGLLRPPPDEPSTSRGSPLAPLALHLRGPHLRRPSSPE